MYYIWDTDDLLIKPLTTAHESFQRLLEMQAHIAVFLEPPYRL